MAGLDNVNETKEVQPAPIVKPVVAKGKFAMPSPTGAVALDPSILASMQEIIAQKEAKRNSFSEGLRDVMAYDVGYRGDLNKSLRERTAEKESDVADIFQMKNQIAQYKAAQAAQAAFEKRRNSELGLGGTGTPGTGAGAPSATPGAQPVGGGMPLEIRNALMNARTEEEYKKIYNEYAKEQAKIKTQYEYNPALDQLVEFPIDGKFEFIPLRQAKELAKNNPALKSKLEKLYPAAATTTVAPPAAATTTTVAPPAAATTVAPPAAATTTVAPPAAATTVAPPAAPRTGSGVGGGNNSPTAIKANIEMQKDIETERGKERVKDEEARLTTLIEQGRKADNRIMTANRISAIAQQDPEMFGVLVKPGVTSAIGTLLKEGIKVGTHGQIALPSVEDMVRRVDKRATPEKLSRAREMDGYLRQVELDFSSAFKGQGAVSDNERKIVQAIAGSSSDPADLLRKKAAWMSLAAQKDKNLNGAWKEYRRVNGKNASFADFEDSSIYQQIQAQHVNKLTQQFNKEVQAYGDKPLVSAEEYDSGVGGKKTFTPSKSQRAIVDKYKKTP